MIRYRENICGRRETIRKSNIGLRRTPSLGVNSFPSNAENKAKDDGRGWGGGGGGGVGRVQPRTERTTETCSVLQLPSCSSPYSALSCLASRSVRNAVTL